MAKSLEKLKELLPQLVLIVSMTGVLGSLFFSEIMNLEACKACWYQRVALYPMPLFIFLAQTQKSKQYLRYLLPLAVFGLFVSILQVSDQFFGTHLLGVINCSGGVSCSEIDFAFFEVISIPVMSMLAFLAIIVAILLEGRIRLPKVQLTGTINYLLASVSALSLFLSIFLTDATLIGNTVANWWERIFLFPAILFAAMLALGKYSLRLPVIVFSGVSILIAGYNLVSGLMGTQAAELNMQNPIMLSLVSALCASAIFVLTLALPSKHR